MARYDKAQLAQIIERELDRSIGGDDSTYTAERLRNLQFYRGVAEGELSPPDTPDRSSIVATDVADTIEWMLPALVRVFAQSPESMECRPKSSRFVPQAKLASEYLRRCYWRKNNGFLITYEWFKAALVQKIGWVKVFYEVKEVDKESTYAGLTAQQVDELLQEPGVKVLEKTARVEVIYPEAQMDQQTGQPVPVEPIEVEVYDLRVGVKREDGRCVVEGVPPEEMRVHKLARYGREPQFIAHVGRRTRAELEADGYKLDGVSPDDDQWSEDEIERRQEQSTLLTDDDEGEHQNFKVVDAYIKLDQDGDGVAEWRRILKIGSRIFEDQKVEDHPFVAFCPNPDPYVLVGQCPADFAVEPQRLNTSLLRALMDNVYLTVNQRTGVIDGQVNLDDLTQNRPGGVVRMKSADSMFPLQQPQLDAGAWRMVEWGEQWRERRTGFTRYSQGMSPDALNPTATGVGIITEKADQRVELIARVAAQAMEEVFRKILRCVTAYQKVAEVVEIAGQWVELNPRDWADGYEIEINVALGTASKDRKAQALQAVFGMQQSIAQMGAAPPQALIATGRAFAEAAGLGEAEQFFPDPPPPGPPQKPPQVQIKEMELQADAQKFQAQQQYEAGKLQMQAQLDQARKAAELEVQRANDERDAARAQQQAELDAQIKRFEAEQRAALDAQKLQLDRYRAELDARVRLILGGVDPAPVVGAAPYVPSAEPDRLAEAMTSVSSALRLLAAPRRLTRDPVTGEKVAVPDVPADPMQ